jgi:hypothetical protein
MDRIRLSRLADELHALEPQLLQEAAILAAGQRGSLDSFATAGRIIAEIIDAGGLEAAEFAPFRAAVRVVAESPKRHWADVLDVGASTLPVSRAEDKPPSPLQVVPFVVGQLRHEVKTSPPKRRRQGTAKKPRPLTARQTEVIQIVGECKGNLAQAATRLGRNRKTIVEIYKAGMKKLGKDVSHAKKSDRLIARDRRGQSDVADIDDSRRHDVDEKQRRKYRRRS